LVEVFLRLGLALLISMGLAVLLAWGWDSSDRAVGGGLDATVSAASQQAITGDAKPATSPVSTE
jgi:hypothetical protein